MAEKDEENKKKRLLIAAVAAAVLAVGVAGYSIVASQHIGRAERLAAHGADGGAPTRRVAQAGGNTPGGGRGGFGGDPKQFAQRRQERMAQMTQALSLTPEQTKQVETLQTSLRPQMRALWQNSSLPQDQKREQMQALRQQAQTQMRALLTPEQQAKFDAMQVQRQARRQEMRSRMEQTRANVIASGQTPPERRQRGGRNAR